MNHEDIFWLFLLVLMVGGMIYMVVELAKVAQRMKFDRVASGADERCQLCGSTELDVRDDEGLEYVCKFCGFDTELRKRQALVEPLGALGLLDRAHYSLDQARQVAELQGVATALFSFREGPATEQNLDDARKALLDGFASLDQIVQDFAPICDAQLLQNGESISDEINAHLVKIGRAREASALVKAFTEYRVIMKDAEDAMALAERVRPALVRAVEQAINEDEVVFDHAVSDVSEVVGKEVGKEVEAPAQKLGWPS